VVPEMENIIDLIIFRYVWILFILSTCFNVIWVKWHKPENIKNNLKELQEYNRLLIWLLFWANLPWIFMGLGILFGAVQRTGQFFRFRDGNSFVIAWWIFLVALWMLHGYWLFFCKGAEKVAKYGMFRYHVRYIIGSCTECETSPLMIKFWYFMFSIGSLGGCIVLWKYF
jgi:hypothetical protein